MLKGNNSFKINFNIWKLLLIYFTANSNLPFYKLANKFHKIKAKYYLTFFNALIIVIIFIIFLFDIVEFICSKVINCIFVKLYSFIIDFLTKFLLLGFLQLFNVQSMSFYHFSSNVPFIYVNFKLYYYIASLVS